MIVRLRSKVGMWRQEADASTKLGELVAKVEHERGVKLLRVSRKADFSEPLQDKGALSLAELGLRHGDMLHVDASGASSSVSGASELVGSSSAKVIDANGNLVAAKEAGSAGGFRPGLQALRTQKLHWTLTDMVEFDNQYTFEVKGEQLSFCASASCEQQCLDSFQLYLQNFAFQQRRCGYLYGKFVSGDTIEGSVEHKARQAAEEKNGSSGAPAASCKRKMKLSDLEELTKADLKPRQGVVVHALYEPLQESSASEFQLLEDPREDKVEAMAAALGLQKVGFVFSHPPGREGYTFATNEIINAGEQVLEATEGKRDSAFVVIACTGTPAPGGGGMAADFQAFSLTPQCLDMVAEDALLAMKDNPGHSSINETFTLIVEKKEAHVVDNDFFIKRVPILMHTNSPFKSAAASGAFPALNRSMGTKPDKAALRAALAGLGNRPTDAAIANALADFNLLVYLSEIFDTEEELVAIAKFVASHKTPGATPLPLEGGYKVVIFLTAGLEIDN